MPAKKILLLVVFSLNCISLSNYVFSQPEEFAPKRSATLTPAWQSDNIKAPVSKPGAPELVPSAEAPGSDFTGAVPQLGEPQVFDLPEPSFYPAAVPSQTTRARSARLERGNQVFEISNDAFRRSGVLERAIRETPELARSFSQYEDSAMQTEELKFQTQAQVDASALSFEEGYERVDNAMRVQQAAANDFESALWETGFNGAKVAAVSSTTNTASGIRRGFVLLDSIGFLGSDNLGYSYTTITSIGEIGATYVPSEYLLPLPQDPNDLFYRQADSAFTQRAPDGWMLMLSEDKTINPIVQALASARYGITHDSGFVNTKTAGTFAEKVDLNSKRANAAGQSMFVFRPDDNTMGDFMLPLDAALNLQVMDIGGGTTGQIFATGNNDFDLNRLNVETFGFRAYVRQRGALFEGWSLVAGSKQSLFGAIELKPQGLDGDRSLVGTVDAQENRSQLSIGGPLTNMLSLNLAVEDPTVNDYSYSGLASGDVTVLKRWPTIAGNLTLTSPDTDEKVVLGALYRPIAYEVNSTRLEQYANGWGLNAIAKVNFLNGTNFIGFAGGNGVGSYIRGINNSIVGSPTTVETLYGYGAFAGRQVILHDSNNDPTAELNLAYGYGMMENPKTFAGPTNRKYHQLWGNYFKYFGDRFGVGAEYQYGFREDTTGDIGENHRVSFLIALRTQKTQKTTKVAEFETMAQGVSDFEPDVMPESAYAPSGATLDGQPLRSIIGQSQSGGAAFRQGL
ncbi:MAG: hypothetical protein AAF483_24400, partial [Planctomycetota bacterium]